DVRVLTLPNSPLPATVRRSPGLAVPTPTLLTLPVVLVLLLTSGAVHCARAVVGPSSRSASAVRAAALKPATVPSPCLFVLILLSSVGLSFVRPLNVLAPLA